MVDDAKTGVKASLTAEEQAVVDRAIALAAKSGYIMELHQCFRNAQAVLAADHTHPEGSRTLCYHEGYAPAPEGAAPHAWVTVNGKIVDVTLQVSDKYESLFDKIKYYGAEMIPVETVLSYFTQAVKDGKYGSVRGLILIPREMI